MYKEHPEVLVKDNMTILAIGALVSFLVALISIKAFIGYVKHHTFRAFGVYRIILGVAILALLYSGMIK